MPNNIIIKNLSYSTENSVIFKNFQFEIKINSINIIKGESGKGKTTLLDILAGLIDPENISFLSYDFNPFKDNITYLPQRPFFLNATVLENIILNNKEYNIKLIEDLLINFNLCTPQKDEIHTFLNRKISTVGTGMSGGQLQRIALIRALISLKSFVFMDESTSALDEKTEIDVITEIQKLGCNINKTFIVVSHNQNWSKVANNFILL